MCSPLGVRAVVAATLFALVALAVPARPREPAKPPLILAHYMPWFTARPTSPKWGWHWTMNAFDPEKRKAGRRDIASHYYPLIGPYDSGDPAVLEYHLLLMKFAGIDGVVVDWYGLSNHFDYPVLHRNSVALFNRASKLRLQFAVCYEDQTVPKLVAAGKLGRAGRVQHVRNEIDWLRKNWFAAPAYVRVNGKPLFLSFGVAGLTDREWEEVFQGMDRPPLYLSEQRRRPAASGAFDWPVPKQYPASLDRFYGLLPKMKVGMPVAFPRFHDVYAEGKAGATIGRIPDAGGRTWERTLRRALTSKAPLVQLATWNDWGEGTGIEPTEEFGYRDLEVVQRFRREFVGRGFPYKPEDLRLPLRLLRLRRRTGPPRRNADLDKVGQLLATGDLSAAKSALERLEGGTGR